MEVWAAAIQEKKFKDDSRLLSFSLKMITKLSQFSDDILLQLHEHAQILVHTMTILVESYSWEDREPNQDDIIRLVKRGDQFTAFFFRILGLKMDANSIRVIMELMIIKRYTKNWHGLVKQAQEHFQIVDKVVAIMERDKDRILGEMLMPF